jgi:hypothetical protein
MDALRFGAWSRVAEDEDELRGAWEEFRERIMAEYQDRRRPGSRPWAWWHFEAGREQHLVPWSEAQDGWWLGPGSPIEERADEYDEWEMEPTLFLASIGELRGDELEQLELAAVEARERVDTGAERSGSGGLDRVDRRKAKLWEAVDRLE